MPNYIKVIANCFPDAEAYTGGDPTVYDDLIWVTPAIDQATLDATDCAQGNPVNVGDATYPAYTGGELVNFWHGPIPFQAGTTQYASADVAPPISEGTEIWALDVTPSDESSTFVISFSLQIDTSKACPLMAAIYCGNTLVGASMRYSSGSDKPGNMHLQFTHRPGHTNPMTISARVGKVDSNGTWYINRSKSHTAGDSLQQEFVVLEAINGG